MSAQKAFFMILSLVLFASGATFVQSPAISVQNNKVIISFSVDAPIDVEVAILDGGNKVLRHLAAGVLGGTNPPPAPLVPGLAQALEWDGFDDYGHWVTGTDFKARVRVGVSPEFEKSISTKVYPASWNVRMGADNVVSTGDLIEMTHPVWNYGMTHYRYPATNPDGSRKISFYAATSLIDMVVSDQTDDIIIGGYYYNNQSALMARLSGITGQLINTMPLRQTYAAPTGGACETSVTRPKWGEPAMDWFGRYFLHDEGSRCDYIARFDLSGQPLNFSSGSYVINTPARTNADYRARGLTTGPDGSIYTANYQALTATNNNAVFPLVVSKYDSNGTLVKDSLILSYGNIGQGVRVDLHGNLFLGMRVKPYGDTVPKTIRSKLTGSFTDVYSQAYWADELYGSIIKFGPEGGSVTSGGPDTLMGGRYMDRVSIKGKKWIHYGASFQSTYISTRAVGCWCYAPRFDVDLFGRVIFPNPFENEFKALDNNGNLMFRVHNRDLYDKVKVGLASTVQATDRAIYLADHPNNQVVCLTWKAEAEQSLPIPALAIEAMALGSGPLNLVSRPNPFSSTTRITVKGTGGANLSLYIYNAQGRKVADLSSGLRGGRSAVEWDGSDLAGQPVTAGLYLCRLTAGSRVLNRSLMLVK